MYELKYATDGLYYKESNDGHASKIYEEYKRMLSYRLFNRRTKMGKRYQVFISRKARQILKVQAAMEDTTMLDYLNSLMEIIKGYSLEEIKAFKPPAEGPPTIHTAPPDQYDVDEQQTAPEQNQHHRTPPCAATQYDETTLASTGCPLPAHDL